MFVGSSSVEEADLHSNTLDLSMKMNFVNIGHNYLMNHPCNV